MENASKALLMAGGILLALMILALVVYVATYMGYMADSQDVKLAAQQLAEFNKSYEAYNKTRLYGIDVITVVNKAINHNRTIEATETDPYYINVIVKPIQVFETTGIVIDNSLPSNHKDYKHDMTPEAVSIQASKANTAFKMEKKEYELGSWSDDGTLKMNKGIIGFFEQNKTDEVIRDGTKTYYIYSALTNFRRAIFKCESMTDTEKDGRIDTIVFTQLDIDD